MANTCFGELFFSSVSNIETSKSFLDFLANSNPSLFSYDCPYDLNAGSDSLSLFFFAKSSLEPALDLLDEAMAAPNHECPIIQTQIVGQGREDAQRYFVKISKDLGSRVLTRKYY